MALSSPSDGIPVQQILAEHPQPRHIIPVYYPGIATPILKKPREVKVFSAVKYINIKFSSFTSPTFRICSLSSLCIPLRL
jgi:hypothetical protein